MVVKSKSVKRKTSHSCNKNATIKRQGVLIDRISLIVLGNGKLEDGLFFQFKEFMKDHKEVVNDISEIKDKLSTVNEINTELEIQRRVKLTEDNLRKEFAELQSKADDKKEDKKKFSWTRFSIVSASIGLVIMAIFQVLNYIKSGEIKTEVNTVNSRVDDLGNPVIISKDGKPLDTRNYTLKMWPKDFTGDTTKADTIK